MHLAIDHTKYHTGLNYAEAVCMVCMLSLDNNGDAWPVITYLGPYLG